MTAVLVANADRMMTSANPDKKGIRLTFADGRSGLIPFSDLPKIKDLPSLIAIEFPNPYELLLRNDQGDMVEIPWDFARHYCDDSYEAQVRAIATRGRESIGSRIRGLRKSAGMTQEQLATNAGVGRVTLVRIENGDQSPRYETLQSLSQALNRPLNVLLAPEGAGLARPVAPQELNPPALGRNEVPAESDQRKMPPPRSRSAAPGRARRH